MNWWLNDSDERFWIYLAGIIDGEGCFGIHTVKRSDAKDGLKPYIAITNTNKELIDSIVKTIPKKIYRSVRADDRNNNHKIAYNIRIENFTSVLYVLDKVEQYLTIKKERAGLVREFINIRLNKMNKEKCFRHLSKEEYQLYEKIRSLNKTGRKIE